MTTMKDYKEIVAKKLKGIDVGVVVLNAGKASVGPFNEVSDEEVEQVM